MPFEEVDAGKLARSGLHVAHHADLPPLFPPIQQEGRARIVNKIATLRARRQGGEPEALWRHILEEQSTSGWRTLATHGGDGHGVGLRHPGVESEAQPLCEQ